MIDDSMLMKTAKIEYERKFPGPAGLIKRKVTGEYETLNTYLSLFDLNEFIFIV